jgi:hypothetical protein
MSDYINDYGLLNAKLADINAENAPLWTMEYLLLKEDKRLAEAMKTYMRMCETGTEGLYHQSPTLHNNKDDNMSPDQLIAFCAAMRMFGMKDQAKSIWRYLWKHLFTYSNMQPGKIDFERTMQLSAISFSAAAAGHWYMRPLVSLVCIWSCATKRQETSGKLKAWVMFKSLNMKITEKICDILIRTNSFLKSWKGVFFEYFKEEGHPIRAIDKFS